MSDRHAGHPILRNLFRQNQWANLVMIDACAATDATILDADAPGACGTIRETLWHIVNSENHFLVALQGHPDAAGIAILEAPHGDLGALREHAARIGDGLVALASEIADDPMLSGEWGDGPYQVPASMFAAQALLHGREHRVQIGEALQHAGIPAPDVDAWSWWESFGESGVG